MATSERVVLITGAASGIGAAVCHRIAGPGTKLLIHARQNQAGLDAVAEAASDAGSELVTKLGDLTDPDVPARLIHTTIEQFGAIDQIVSNAGFAQRGFIDADIDNLTQAERGMPDAFFWMTSPPYRISKIQPAAGSSRSPRSSPMCLPPMGCSQRPPPPRPPWKHWPRRWRFSSRHPAPR